MLIIVRSIWQWSITASMLYINLDRLPLFQCFDEFYCIITHYHVNCFQNLYDHALYICYFILCFVKQVVI